MDDDLGSVATVPTLVLKTNDEADLGDESGDEEIVDWTKLSFVVSMPRIAITFLMQQQRRGVNGLDKPVIPKRGEKDFEPVPGGGSSLQTYSLDRARLAMTDALRGSRTISSYVSIHVCSAL